MFSHLKRRIGVLTAVAVLAALVPTLSISPAAAAASATAVTLNDTATFVSCPSGSAAAAGFTDTTSTDVDCIAMYGITTGVTATTYEPTASIPRWQMALYLTRFATAAGVTLGSGADQGFTDISGESAAIQTAINQLKQLGVTNGTTATTYSPADNVTREQMAMFIERTLALTVAGPGGEGAQTTYGTTKVSHTTLTYNYTDIDAGGVTFEGHNAIAEIYHLGIPGHTSSITTFGPAGEINRGEMATWLTNALAHSNARPAGVWVQSARTAAAGDGFGTEPVAVHVSHRDSARAAAPGTLVDVFSDVNTANTDPFSATTGACTTANLISMGNGVTACTINLGDDSTDAFGNIAGDTGLVPANVVAATTVTYYAFTGALAATYNNLTAPGNTSSVAQSTGASSLTLTNSIPTSNSNDATDTTFELVRYGTTVTITGTLKTSSLTAVAAARAIEVIETTILVGGTALLGDNGTDLTNAGGGLDKTESVVTTTGTTDATGVWTHTITVADPTPVGTALSSVLSRHQTTSMIFVDLDGDGVKETNAGTVSISWDDNPQVVSKVTATEGSYHGAGVAVTGVSRTSTATVYDQFGVGVASQTVTFTNAGTAGTTATTDSFTDATTRITNASGVATLAYTDLQTDSAKMITTATSTAAGTSTFYRTVAAAAAFSETEAATNDGTVVATNFTAADTADRLTFSGAHLLAVGDEIIVDTGLVSAAIGGDLTALTAGNVLVSTTAHGLAVGDIVEFTTAPTDGLAAAVAGLADGDVRCVTSVTGLKNFTVSATVGTPEASCTAASASITIAADGTIAGVLKRVSVPVGEYYVATVPSTLTATLSGTRTANALGAVYTTFKIDEDGAASSGTAKLTSGSEFDTGDTYMEVVINDAANDQFVVENQLLVGDYNYSLVTYDSGDQFNIGGDTIAGASATTLAGFETVIAAKFSSGVPTGADGDIFAMTYVNALAGGGVSIFTAGS